MGVKQRSTYYTKDKVEAVRRNVRQYDWAKPYLERAVKEGDVYVELGWEWLWNMPTPQSIPRSYAVNQQLGCPACGEDHHAYGRWPWLADPVNQPWKLICPSCRSVFPSNDFASFYESGKDKQGLFRQELADPRYLVNELYPDKGPEWGVDAGHGWKDGQGDYWTFIAFYNHWKVWCWMVDPGGNLFPKTEAPWGHGGIVGSAVQQLQNAYLFSGELKYAKAGLILLDRIADLYPDMDCGVFRWEEGMLNSHGLSGQGKIVGSIWETGIAASFARAYDAFFPALSDEAGMADVVAFLQEKANRFALPDRKSSTADIGAHLEDGLLRQIYEGVKKAQIFGNNGSHQSALTLAAVVLDEPGTTEEWLDFVLRNGRRLGPEEGGWAVSGGNMLHSLVQDVDRDGFGNEAAPNYNNIWVYTFKIVADILQGYDRYPNADLYRHPKFRQMLRAHAGLLMIDRYMPQIGDSDSVGNPGLLYNTESAVDMFVRTGEPLFAQLAVLTNGGTTEGLRGGLFSDDPEQVLKDIKQAIAEHGSFRQESLHLGGYGFVALRDGVKEDQRAVWLYHGRNKGHGHKDSLNLGLYAFGLDLAPELGYPEKCDNSHQKTHHWDRSTVAHNTVTVDGGKQKDSVIGVSRLFAEGEEVQVMEMEVPLVYPQVSVYRRCTAMVRLDEQHSYAIDIFQVEGGTEHVYSFHGAEGEVVTEGLRLERQEGGTYAGAAVAFGEPYDAIPAEQLRDYKGSGFHYLSDVERDTAPPASFAAEWALRDTWGVLGERGADSDVRLRLTMLSETDEVAFADGHPSSNRPGNPERLRYLLAKRQPADGVSRFVAVLEPYRRGQRLLRAVSRCAVRAADGSVASDAQVTALRIERADGRVDYFVHAADPARTYTIAERIVFQGTAGLYAERDGQPVYAFVAGGSRIGLAAGGEGGASGASGAKGPVIDGARPSLNGEIVGFSRGLVDENWLQVRFADLPPAGLDLTGLHIHAASGSERNPVFRLCGWTPSGMDPREVRLDLGRVTLVEDWAPAGSAQNAAAEVAATASEPAASVPAASDEAAYRYSVAVGDRFAIPLTAEWRA